MPAADLLLNRPFALAVAFVFGTVFGSFLNVVIHRLPRGESLVHPPSHCPSCGAAIRPWDNVPVLSWLLLGGRCRRCRSPISFRYPLVETVSGLLAAAVVGRYGFTITAACYFAFIEALVAVFFIDLDHQIIPDAITLPGAVVGFLVLKWTEVTFLEALIGAAAGFALLLAIGAAWERMRGQEAMGGGDIKLAAMLGAFLGWKGVLMTIFFGSFLGAAFGLGAMALGRAEWKSRLPFGTFLAPAAILVLFVGRPLADWYVGLLSR